MLLQRVMERNPNLIDAAVRLHQEGKIPANTWLFDLDAIADNARMQAKAARELGLTTYIMTKQYGRNPMISKVAIKQGLYKTVAVDIHGAKMMHRYRIPIGHIGHLNQIPKHDVAAALDMRPDVITVFSTEAARRISEIAVQKGVTQELLVRVYRPGDVFFPGQEGGFRFEELLQAVSQIERMPNVRVVGVTTFPCIHYSFQSAENDDPARLNPNVDTIMQAAKLMEQELGIEIKQINAPGNTSIQTFPALRRAGATHVEPGHGLLGTTPSHIAKGNLPEKPTYVYVTEVSHHYEGRAYAFAGGLWSLMGGFLDPSWPVNALVGTTPELTQNNLVDYEHLDQIIDYHASLVQGDRCKVGDSVVMGIYTQVQMTRTHVAAVSGISSGNPVVWGIFDHANTMLDQDYNPVSPDVVIRRIDEMLQLY